MLVRQSSHVFVNLLILMLVSGIEELTLESIAFIKNVLFLDLSDEEASLAFKSTI